MFRIVCFGHHCTPLRHFFIPLILCIFTISVNAAKSKEKDEETEGEDVGLQQQEYEEPQQQGQERPFNDKPLSEDKPPAKDKPPSADKPPPPSEKKKAPHTFVEKIQAALDSKNSKIMHSYLKELMRLRINLDKIKDDLQDVTYDDVEEIKGLREFLEYLDFAINHGMECIQAGLNEDRKSAVQSIPGVTEGPRIQFSVKPIDKNVVLQMMDSVRSLKTCLRDQKKRCKRLYAEAKEAIVVAQERLTEAIEAYTDLLQHIEGKSYNVQQDLKPEEDDDDASQSRSN